MRRGWFALVAFVAVMPTVGAHAQTKKADVVVGYDFEQGAKPWQTMDPQAQIGLAADAEHVREGTSSLECKYRQRGFGDAAGGVPGSVVLPIEGGLIGVNSLHLSVKAIKAAPLVIGFAETNGANYNVPVWVPVNQWTDIDLPLSAFALDVDGGKPDPDGRLDVDQVGHFMIIDASPFMKALADSGAIPLVKPTLGDQALYLDNVEFRSSTLPAEKPAEEVAEGQGVVIETCRHKFAPWIVLGGEAPLLTETPSGDDAGLKLTYTTAADTIVAMFHPLPSGLIKGIRRVEFSAKVSADTAFMIGFEQLRDPRPQQGDAKARFMTSVQLKTADGWKPISIPISEFKQDGKEPPVPQDPSKFCSMLVGDMTAPATHAPVKNVLMLDDILGVK